MLHDEITAMQRLRTRYINRTCFGRYTWVGLYTIYKSMIMKLFKPPVPKNSNNKRFQYMYNKHFSRTQDKENDFCIHICVQHMTTVAIIIVA